MARVVDRKLVFVVGTGRSGTTMFWNFFRQLPDYIAYSEPFALELYNWVNANSEQLPPTDPIMHHYNVNTVFDEYAQLDRRALRGHICFCYDPWDRITAYLDYLIKDKTKSIVIKSVRLGGLLNKIKSHYPKCYLIYIWRDFEAQQKSITRLNLEGRMLDDYSKVVGEKCGSILELYQETFREAQQEADIMIRYEDIITDPATALTPVMEPVGLGEYVPVFAEMVVR